MMVGAVGVCMFMTAPLRAPQDRLDGEGAMTMIPGIRGPITVRPDTKIVLPWFYCYRPEAVKVPSSPPDDAGAQDALAGQALSESLAFFKTTFPKVQALLNKEDDVVRTAVLTRADILRTHRQLMLCSLDKLCDCILHFVCSEENEEYTFMKLHDRLASSVRELAREKDGIDTKIADTKRVKGLYFDIKSGNPKDRKRVFNYVNSLRKLCFPDEGQEARIQELLPKVYAIWNAETLPPSLKEGVPQKHIPKKSPLLPGGFALEGWAKVLDHLLAKGMIYERVSLGLTCPVLYHLSFSSHRFQHALLLTSFYFNVPEGNAWDCIDLKGSFLGEGGSAHGSLKHSCKKWRSEFLMCTLNPPRAEHQEVIEFTAHFSRYNPYEDDMIFDGKGGKIIFGPLDLCPGPNKGQKVDMASYQHRMYGMLAKHMQPCWDANMTRIAQTPELSVVDGALVAGSPEASLAHPLKESTEDAPNTGKEKEKAPESQHEGVSEGVLGEGPQVMTSKEAH